uniref:Uncharacterized protein n=1 Tax=Bionectria ochroleuca TaxID=29856 RepID=A0A8H7N4S2_BIOOC
MRLLASVGAVAGISAWALFRTTNASKMALAPVIALSHGGGPLPILGDPDHRTIIDSLEKRIPKLLSRSTPPPTGRAPSSSSQPTGRPSRQPSPAARSRTLFTTTTASPGVVRAQVPRQGRPRHRGRDR